MALLSLAFDSLYMVRSAAISDGRRWLRHGAGALDDEGKTVPAESFLNEA
jgi:hypothetical protein